MSSILNPTPSGASNSDTVQVVSFAYDTPSPMLLQAVTPGQIVNRAVVVVTVPFDDPTSSILLGTTTDVGLILGADDVTTSAADQYDNDALFEFTIDDFLLLTINPGASTQGQGFLFYRIKE